MKFSDVKIYDADIFTDFRGDIFTTYQKNTFQPEIEFIHDKYSTSRKNVLRGIHGDHKTWKLVSCLYGELYFVVVDNRPTSSKYLEWDWMILDDRSRKQVLLPPGFGNGFYVLSEYSIFSYKLAYSGDYSDIGEQFTLKWDDDRIKIDWPINKWRGNPILQMRDR